MDWLNVKLIFLREVRDQLRDRRTLFMIAVLPLLLYPLLGMSMLQVAQFRREQPTRVLMIGLPTLADFPPLVEGSRFAPQWLSDPQQERLFELNFESHEHLQRLAEGSSIAEKARTAIQNSQFEAVVVFPEDFGRQLERFRRQLLERRVRSSEGDEAEGAVPSPIIYCNTANEKSRLAYTRLAGVLRAWAEAVGEQNLKDSQLPLAAAKPFQFERQDVAEPRQLNAAIWSKILPFVLLIWALTGAFYPAIDLCAGEKERGTLETLLSSPAQRSEIVTGKLLTVMAFSIATSLLNLVSMGATGALVISHMPAGEIGPRLGMPPLLAPVWLLLALLPVSALFSALCVALAAFARSSKEGQYYLMPLVLVTMPLVILPMSPGVELNLGNSLIPLTGLVLLLRALLEGNYLQALPYVAPVVGVTLLCCLLAVRWAVDQFNKESVLFRESERLDMGLWLRHLVRDRGATPSVAEAITCGLLILLIRFVMGLVARVPATPGELLVQLVITELAVVAAPALLMTVMLTRSPRQTLLLRRPTWWALPAAALLAVALHPVVKLLQVVVGQLYPVSPSMKGALESIQHMFGQVGNFWVLLAAVAFVPAVLEELAFRGFILSGFRHLGHKWRAILLSSLFFGVFHTILQQSVIGFLVGMVIGYLAVQTGSIFPAMVFHFTHNALALIVVRLSERGVFRQQMEPYIKQLSAEDFIYAWWVFGAGMFLAGWLLMKLAGLSYRKTNEEALQETIERQMVEANA